MSGDNPIQYQLRRRYWDGTRMHLVGEILSFPEGGAPRSAVPVKATELAGVEKSAPASTKATK